MDELLGMIGRTEELFVQDLASHEEEIRRRVEASRILVIGGAGSIGRATTKELFQRNPSKLYIVDLSENNMTELVRDIRSSLGYIEGEFKTFFIDVGSREFDAFMAACGPFDHILNFSALKHVRSERDPFTLMRMIRVLVEVSQPMKLPCQLPV